MLSLLLKFVLDMGYTLIRGKVWGKAEGVLDFLSDYGEVPKELKDHILKEKDLSLLKKWMKIAAKVSTIEEFLQKYQQ